MKSLKTLHDEKVKSMAQELSEKGYEVLIEPSNSQLPFDLEGYNPDLIARKNNEGIIVEIKSNLKHLSVDKFQNIAKRIASQNDWRFILVPIQKQDEEIILANPNSLPSWKELKIQLFNVQTLIEQSQFLPVIVLLWTILEATLRKRAIKENLPIENFAPIHLLNHTFSSGEISLSQFDLFKKFFSIKNKVVHGSIMSTDSIDLKILQSANDSVNCLVESWSL